MLTVSLFKSMKTSRNKKVAYTLQGSIMFLQRMKKNWKQNGSTIRLNFAKKVIDVSERCDLSCQLID